ncbi:histidinol-phosphatase [Marinobacterium arenosum]|uniref:histidinol-phosphatase n=1 Tax=Marinobacterium arenosum TaxID=2862496 RepID=UPI001C942DDE|nr:histidinol-phosphatase [Marinobacterium arenosum]MBY4677669.1 histidinol-phosphatase [Marinobacterium arenosum]
MSLTPAELAVKMADRAREVIGPYFRAHLSIDDKSDASPVTIADKNTEAELRAMLAEHFPDHNIIGEEHGRTEQDSEYTWIIDPIDGTRAFITGMPTFGTLICQARNNRPELGVIDIPMVGDRWLAQVGQGATLNGEPCKVSATQEIKDALLFCTDPDMFVGEQIDQFKRVEQACRMRRFGGDCYSYGLLAAGHVDLIVEADLKIYDVMALIPVIEEAGGIITDWQGKPLYEADWDGTAVAAATPELHRQALALLNG